MTFVAGNQWLWVQAMCLLSLDLTEAFSKELRTEGFYSQEIKHLARASLPAVDGAESFDEWFSRATEHVDSYTRALTERLGPSVVGIVAAWVKDVFHARAPCDMEEAERRLQELVQAWDTCALADRLPLSLPTQAQLRLAVMDHLAHIRNVETEIERTSDALHSTWDAALESRYGVPEWARTEVWARWHDIASRAFWGRMDQLARSDDTADLRRWCFEN